MNTIGVALVLAFLFGYSNKMADLMNEHGVYWFRGGDLVFGALFAATGAGLVLLTPSLGATYTAIVLGWLLFRKLDYRNHALAGVTMLLAAIYTSQTTRLDFVGISLMTLGYLATGWLQHRLRGRMPTIDMLLRLRLRIYAIPLGYSIAIADPLPLVCTIAGMVPVEIVTRYYQRRETMQVL